MTVYVVLIEDRHSDVGVEIFLDASRAIEYAENIALEYSSYPDDIEVVKSEGRLYHAIYAGDSDAVTVISKEVHE